MSPLPEPPSARRLPRWRAPSTLARLDDGLEAGTSDRTVREVRRQAGSAPQDGCATTTPKDGRIGPRSGGRHLVIGGRLASGSLGEGDAGAPPLPCRPDRLLRLVELRVRVLVYEGMLRRAVDAPSLLMPAQPVGEASTRPRLRVRARRASRRHPFGSPEGIAATTRRLARSTAADEPSPCRELTDDTADVSAGAVAEAIVAAVVGDERARRSDA